MPRLSWRPTSSALLVLKAQLFAKGLTERQAKVDAALEAYEQAVAEAEELADMPDVSGWGLLDLDGKRRVARFIIDTITVAPPASPADRGPRADVAKRFDVNWKRRGELAAA